MTLVDLSFDRGARLTVVGTVDANSKDKVLDYTDKLRSLSTDGRAVFKEVSVPNMNRMGSTTMWNWSFGCELGGGAE